MAIQPGNFIEKLTRFQKRLEATKQRNRSLEFSWYPYDTLNGVLLVQELLKGDLDRLLDLLRAGPVLDAGCADGDLAFFLESLGCTVDAADHPVSNVNAMRGVKTLKQALQSSVTIHAIDLDAPFSLPRSRYTVSFLFGVLYHLKNPFGALEMLARYVKYCFLSTRVARFDPEKQAALRSIPVAYLLDDRESNDDPTNYWIFSEAGLRRILNRTRWDVCEFMTTGNTINSDPASGAGDERAICLLVSRVFDPLAEVEFAAGWHALEEGSWRWTERRFSVNVRIPRALRSARLELQFVLPEAVWTHTGPITLRAAANGQMLPPETYESPGEYRFERPIPSGLLTLGSLEVVFELDKSLAPSARDARELGIVVSRVEMRS